MEYKVFIAQATRSTRRRRMHTPMMQTSAFTCGLTARASGSRRHRVCPRRTEASPIASCLAHAGLQRLHPAPPCPGASDLVDPARGHLGHGRATRAATKKPGRNLTIDSFFPVAVVVALAVGGVYRVTSRRLQPSAFLETRELPPSRCRGRLCACRWPSVPSCTASSVWRSPNLVSPAGGCGHRGDPGHQHRPDGPA